MNEFITKNSLNKLIERQYPYGYPLLHHSLSYDGQYKNGLMKAENLIFNAFDKACNELNIQDTEKNKIIAKIKYKISHGI